MTDTTGFVDESQLPIEGLVKQQLITYVVKNGKMRKTTVERKYMKGADYQDCTTTEILYSEN